MIVEAGAAETVGSRIDPRPVLIVTGLVQEARIAAGPGMIVICSSSDPQQLRELLATLDPTTFRGVISFGVAGGLDPSLKSGDVVVATDSEVIAAAVEKAGAQAVMTRTDHASGSDRIFEALNIVDPQGRAAIVVNVQGDLPTLAADDLRAALGISESDAGGQ